MGRDEKRAPLKTPAWEARNTEIIKKNFHYHQENLGIAVLSVIPLRKTFFLTRVIFIQGAFKNIQGLLKDIPQLFNFQGFFKARANYVENRGL